MLDIVFPIHAANDCKIRLDHWEIVNNLKFLFIWLDYDPTKFQMA